MGEGSQDVRRYGAEVVGWLRRWLIEEGRRTLLGSWGYEIRTEGVALEGRGGGWAAVIRFRLACDARPYGFVVRVAEEDNLLNETPEANAQTVVILLDEAILTRGRTLKPDETGVVWLR